MKSDIDMCIFIFFLFYSSPLLYSWTRLGYEGILFSYTDEKGIKQKMIDANAIYLQMCDVAV